MGQIVCYKARLVAKGFKQQFGVNYTDTFAPTVRSATLQVLLALAAAHKGDIIIEQADVKNAYLYAWMKDDETVFMDLPELYSDLRKLPKPVNNASRNGNRIVLHLK